MASGSGDEATYAVPVRTPEELAGAPPAFDPELYMPRLRTAALGHVLLSASSLPSTQTLLYENGGCVPSGAVCVADRQHAGRGAGLRVLQLRG